MAEINWFSGALRYRAVPRTSNAQFLLRKVVPAVVVTAASAFSGAAVCAEENAATLDDIVVTARNRQEAAQSVPIPVSVLTSKDLEQDNSVTFTDFSHKLPDVSIVENQPRQSSVSIRGIGKNNSGENFEGAVGVLVDGVYQSHPGQNWGNFIDLDRVEVDRGPQGTLQGKNTTMGVINVSTKAPSFEKSSSFEIGYGEYNTVRAQAMSTGPLVDGVLAYRATLGYEAGNGPIKNLAIDGQTLDNLNRINGRFQLLATPAEWLTARVIFDVSRSSEYNAAWPINLADPQTYTDGAARFTGASSASFTQRTARFSGYSSTIPWGSYTTYAANDNAPLINNSQGLAATLLFNLGGGYTLTSVTAAHNYLFQPHNDYDTLNGTGSEQYYGGKVDTTEKSQELRINSPLGGAIDYQTGLYYLSVVNNLLNTPGATFGSDNGTFLATNAQFAALNASAVGQQLLTDSLNGGQNYSTQIPVSRSIAAYGQLNWHIDEKVTLTTGLRETHENRSDNISETNNSSSLIGLTTANFPGATATQIADAVALRKGTLKTIAYNSAFLTHDSVAWLVNPSYKLSSDVLLYGSVSHGEKSGVVQFSSTGASLPNVNPERALDYELGIKSTLLNKTLRLNANLFETNITNYQTQIEVPALNNGATTWSSLWANAPKVVVKGIEVDSNYAPDRHWSFFLTGAYAPARYASWSDAPCPPEIDPAATPVCNNTGKRLPGASDLTLALGLDYRSPLANGLQWHAFLNDAYRSGYNADTSLSTYGTQGGFSLFEGGIGFGKANGDWDLTLLGKNLLNKQYLISISDGSSTTPTRGAAGAPQFFGITFRAKL